MDLHVRLSHPQLSGGTFSAPTTSEVSELSGLDPGDWTLNSCDCLFASPLRQHLSAKKQVTFMHCLQRAAITAQNVTVGSMHGRRLGTVKSSNDRSIGIADRLNNRKSTQETDVHSLLPALPPNEKIMPVTQSCGQDSRP